MFCSSILKLNYLIKYSFLGNYCRINITLYSR
jgi:hypothetical protein